MTLWLRKNLLKFREDCEPLPNAMFRVTWKMGTKCWLMSRKDEDEFIWNTTRR